MKYPASLYALVAAASLAAPAARCDTITDWNSLLVAVMLAEKTHAPMQSRNAALVHGAMYQAVNAIDRRYAPYGATLPAPAGSSPEAAAATAAHRTLLALYPSQAAALQAALARSLDAIPDGVPKRDGIGVGELAASQLLQLRSDDGSSASQPYVKPDTPTAYVPAAGTTPVAPHWGSVKPWLLKSGAQFRPAGPPAISSEQFRRDYQEVKALGSKTDSPRTPEQLDIARFWIPPGVPSWSPVARQLSAAAGLGLADNARLFALLGMATADAITACWDAKYTYNFLRPDAAIRTGQGGEADPGWQPAIPTPPFPAYVSGHACFGGAAQAVLESAFGNAPLAVPVTLTSPTAPGVTRHYASLADIVAEASNARIWGGIHWRTDQLDGEELGRQVGRYAISHAFGSTPGMAARSSDNRQ